MVEENTSFLCISLNLHYFELDRRRIEKKTNVPLTFKDASKDKLP